MKLPKGVLCVVGGLCIHLVLGTLYCWGNITTFVTAYLRRYDQSITYNDTLLVYATALGCQGLFMFLGGVLEKNIGPKYTCLIGGYLIVFGTLLSSFMTTLNGMILSEGVFFGIGLGLSYSAPIACSVRWMPSRKGLVTGYHYCHYHYYYHYLSLCLHSIIVAGFGGGSFIFGLISTRLVNPGQLNIASTGSTDGYFSPDSDVVKRVPLMFAILSILYFLLVTFGVSLISDPADTVETRLDETSNVILDDEIEMTSNNIGSLTTQSPSYQAASTVDPENEIGNNITEKVDDAATSDGVLPVADIGPRDLIKMPLAYHLASCFILTTVGGMYLAGTFKVYAQKSFSSELFLSTIGSIASIFNAGGRIFWGYLADRIGVLETLIIMSFLFSIVIFTYSYSPLLHEAGFTIWTFAIFFFEGANFALYLPMSVQLFGSKYASSNYGLIFSCYSFINVVNITLLAKNNADFEDATTLMGFVTFVGFMNLLLFSKHAKANTQFKQCKIR